MNENQRINVDINRQLWQEVGIRCAEKGVTKRTFMEEALIEKLERGRDKPDKSD